MIITAAVALLAAPLATARAESTKSDAAPPPSTWAATLKVPATNQHSSQSDGDLWPSCWAEDNAIYTAWGDGTGFDAEGRWVDLGTARITGPANDLQGTNTALSEDVAPLWNGDQATRKPTGMVCVGNTLYLAVQDLSFNFSHAPAATIVKSTDGGRTWTGDTDQPMFDDHLFTTIWFADFGKGGRWNTTDYVYAYGLDGNWRNSPPPFDDVPDPVDMFLARVPKSKIQKRGAWEFFAGYKKDGSTPVWSAKMGNKTPVLHDARRDYPKSFSGDDWTASTVLGQGGVTYNKALDRYLYVGWSEWVHHFYESPTPWGPWKLIMDKDYTTFDDREVQYGGYGTSLPSKFISKDGTRMKLQSNRCCGGSTGYQYALRPIEIGVHQDSISNPEPDNSDLALDPATVPISKSVQSGSLAGLSNQDAGDSLDDWDGGVKSDSWWGYTWPSNRKINNVTFTTGTPQEDGGWFITTPQVQFRQDGRWSDVEIQGYESPFERGATAGDHASYEVRFPTVTADGIRIIGTPGGDHTYSSMSELSARFVGGSVVDGGFENTAGYGDAWQFDGTAGHGIDRGCCARSGSRNAWVRTDQPLGDQYVYQSVPVSGGEQLDLSAWVRTTAVVEKVYLGIRWDGGSDIKTLTPDDTEDYQQYSTSVTVPVDATSVDVVIGYRADGGDAIFQLDDVDLQSP
jgi:hypothetical protein